jgi:hypothetical protein
MTEDQAIRLLQQHAGRDDSDPAKFQSGFLGQLRPYVGRLNEANFLEIMAAISVVAPRLASENTVSRELMAALWNITWLPRAWAFSPGGMLRRNRLIGGRELSRLDDWLCRIGEAVGYALEGAVENVGEVMNDYRSGDSYADYLSEEV